MADFQNHTIRGYLSGLSLCTGWEKDKFLIWVTEFLYQRIWNKTKLLIQRSWCCSVFIIRPKRRNRYFFCPIQIGKCLIHQHCRCTAAAILGCNCETADCAAFPRKQQNTCYFGFFFYADSLPLFHKLQDGGFMRVQLFLCFETREIPSNRFYQVHPFFDIFGYAIKKLHRISPSFIV